MAQLGGIRRSGRLMISQAGFFWCIGDVGERRYLSVPDLNNHQRLVAMMRGWLHMQCLHHGLSRFKRRLEGGRGSNEIET